MTITAPPTHANGAPPVPPVVLRPAPPFQAPEPPRHEDSTQAPRGQERAPAPDIAPDSALDKTTDKTTDSTADRLPLRAWRAIALYAIAALITTASGAAFAESYRGLLDWATRHGLSGFWAAAFPLQVDVFIGVGELTLFIAMIDQWRLRSRLGAWAFTLAGLAVSVAGNIGHVGGTDIQTRGTAAVPPVAAFAALWLGLGVLKRVTGAARGQDSNPDNSTDKAADSKPARSRWRRQRTTDRAPDKTPDTEPDKAPRRPRVLPDKVAAAVKRHPDWDDDRIAASCGVSAKTVKRRRAALATAQKAPTGT